MSEKKRDMATYELVRGPGKRWTAQHRTDGDKLDLTVQTSRRITEEGVHHRGKENLARDRRRRSPAFRAGFGP